MYYYYYYFHFGIKESLSRSRQLLGHLADSDNHTNTIFLQDNIDGLPLFHSSCKQFWPILGRVCRPVESDPFVTELFCGEKKSENLGAFCRILSGICLTCNKDRYTLQEFVDQLM